MNDLTLNLFLPTVNCKVSYEEDFVFRDIEGLRHIEHQNPKSKVEVSRIYFNLTNLFNGDAGLSKFTQYKQLTGTELANVLSCVKCSLAQGFTNFTQILEI